MKLRRSLQQNYETAVRRSLTALCGGRAALTHSGFCIVSRSTQRKVLLRGVIKKGRTCWYALMLRSKSSFLTRNDHGGSIRLQFVADEFVYIGFNQFTIDHPGFLGQDIPTLGQRRGFEKDVIGRAPFSGVSRRLPVAKMSSLIPIFSRFGFTDDRVGRAAWRKESTDGVSRAV